MSTGLVIKADDLVGHPERDRRVDGSVEAKLRLGDTTVDGPLSVNGIARGTVDGVQVDFEVSANADMTCVRCLKTWTDLVEAKGSQHYAKTPDEDGYGIFEGEVDVSGPAKDELALALPAAPVHSPDCKGLCPICGTDLNSDPCDGHGDDSDSPFSVLKDLFDS